MKKSHLKALNTVVRIRSKIDHLNVYIYGGDMTVSNHFNVNNNNSNNNNFPLLS